MRIKITCEFRLCGLDPSSKRLRAESFLGYNVQIAEMARRKDSKALPSIALRVVVPSAPKGEKERSLPKEELQRMECHGLLEQPWCLRDKGMVAKLLKVKFNEWKKILKQELDW